ncbi:MAG: hypothetical protein L6R42_003432 [Xanthoria sp. 1 TBL-2021]|nr:MAG: hypothetical protein L6R42_003432 [Xanthoria sp. 1 TBL-2021]
MDTMFGAIGPKAKSSGLNMARMAPAASLDWPQREPCNNLSDQIQSTRDQASILLNSIARVPAWGSMTQMNRASVINFISNVQRMCEMIPAPDSAGLQTQPAGAHSSSQQDVLQTLEEIKRLKQDMDRKVAAVEAAIRPRDNSVATVPANASGTGSDMRMDGREATPQTPLHMPVFGALGWSEHGKTYSMHATQATVDLRSDVPILGTSQLTRHSTGKPNSDIQASGENIKAGAGTVMPTRNPGNGAESLTYVAPAGAENFPKVSGSRATGESLTAMNGRTNTHHTIAPTSGISSNPKPIEIQPSTPDSHVPQAGDAIVESNTHSSSGQAADESMSGSDSDSDNRSSTDRTATAPRAHRAASSSAKAQHSLRRRQISSQIAPSSSGQAADEAESYSDRSSSIHPSATASSSNEEASESTERIKTDANSRVTSNQTAVESTIRASESASATPLPQEFGDGTDDEDSDDDGTDDEDSNDESSADEDSNDESSADEDTQMDDTETSEQSEESDAPQPKPIEIWRKGIAKPKSTAVPKSLRAVSPSTTIPAPPVKKVTRYLLVLISITDRRIISELKGLTEPELKCRLEREILNKKSRIQSCKVMPSGGIRIYTTDGPGSRILQKPSNWRPGAFGKGASVLAHKPKRKLPSSLALHLVACRPYRTPSTGHQSRGVKSVRSQERESREISVLQDMVIPVWRSQYFTGFTRWELFRAQGRI